MKESATEQKILRAARPVFQQQGYAGARMRDIAEQAGINKGLLHYYFKSKEKLFEAIFQEAYLKIVRRVNETFTSAIPLFEKIDAFIDAYIDLLEGDPNLLNFVISELNRNPEEFTEMLRSIKQEVSPRADAFAASVEEEVRLGNIRPIAPNHLLVNIVSLCAFPVIGQHFMREMLDTTDRDMKWFLAERKRSVSEFIRHSLTQS